MSADAKDAAAVPIAQLSALADEWVTRCATPECNWIHAKANRICADELRSLWRERGPFGAAATALATQPDSAPAEGAPERVSEADQLLADLGLDPERFRTEGGAINHAKVKAAIQHPADYTGLYLHTKAPFERDRPGFCNLCGEPLPLGEQMFKFHGYSGNCPEHQP